MKKMNEYILIGKSFKFKILTELSVKELKKIVLPNVIIFQKKEKKETKDQVGFREDESKRSWRDAAKESIKSMGYREGGKRR